MSTQGLIYLFVGLSFALYIGIAIVTRARSTGDFYVAGGHVHPVVNGMATAADWMSAASFLSMAGIIAFSGYDGSVYLMGWTGGYRAAGTAAGALPAQVRPVHRARLHRRRGIIRRPRASSRWCA